MAKIPFDIKYRPQIESGEYKVETKAGCPVRIVCWDMACELPILGLVLLNDKKPEEIAVSFTNKGTNLLEEPLYDKLFIIIPEEELSEFEQGVSDIVEYCKEHRENVAFDYAKRHAAELLSLAREQLKPEIDAALEKAYKNADEVQYKKGWEDAIDDHREALRAEYEKGKADALKEIEQDPESSYAFKRGVEYGKEEACEVAIKYCLENLI